ncbi:uncharacterized protein Bfra_003171 [Botrytis fragariae]|uniref:Uncharacterized protein n=1 Tax=Botrytis fragariae TaxID=1964551 RepID=A0A8H6ELX5_9HELO|nr:uncharacterized protein Bfra_003171 [Botrytis fragariae]KAF5876765.1 hypothetical protein Bfra_003171 [Botrytis fragariae]
MALPAGWLIKIAGLRFRTSSKSDSLNNFRGSIFSDAWSHMYDIPRIQDDKNAVGSRTIPFNSCYKCYRAEKHVADISHKVSDFELNML